MGFVVFIVSLPRIQMTGSGALKTLPSGLFAFCLDFFPSSVLMMNTV